MLKKFIIGFLVALLLVGPSYATITLTSNSGLTPGTTPVGTATNCILYADGASLLQCDATLVYNNSGSANGVFTFLKNPSGSSITSNFFNATGTVPASLSASFIHSLLALTVVNQAQDQTVLKLTSTGTSGNNYIRDLQIIHLANNNGNGSIGIDIDGSGGTSPFFGVTVKTPTATSGFNYGLTAWVPIGASGQVGVAGILTAFNSATLSGIRSAAYFDNGSNAVDILQLRDNANLVFEIADGGLLNFGNNVTTTTAADASRQYVAGDKNLTEASATTFLVINLPSGSATTAVIEYEVFATDTTDYQIGSGRLRVRYLDKAGTMTCANPTEVEAFASSTTTGTLTSAGFTSTSGSNLCNVQANITSSLTQTILRIKYHAWKLEGTGNLTPQ